MYVEAKVERETTGKTGDVRALSSHLLRISMRIQQSQENAQKNRTLKNLSSAERVFHAGSMFRDVSPKYSTDCPLTPKKDRFNTYLVSPPFPFGDTNLIQFVQFFWKPILGQIKSDSRKQWLVFRVFYIYKSVSIYICIQVKILYDYS